jgi:tetratricopeptide (TPR) repeat protein
VLRSAYDAFPENIKALERMGEVLAVANDAAAASHAFAEAAFFFQQAGRVGDAERCRTRAEETQPGAVAEFDSQAPPPPPPQAGSDAPMAAGVEEPAAAPPSAPVAGVPVPPVSAAASRVMSGPEPGSVDLFSSASPDPAAASAPAAAPAPAPAAPAAPSSAPAPQRLEVETTAIKSAPKPSDDDMPTDLKGVERLLASAQKEFRAGNRERAAEILAKAAQAFESFGRLDNAASIYRSLCNGPHATKQTLELWLRNCERREDRREAGTVACELGDRAIQENKLELAREWFERARAYDSNNLVARRRLDRLQPGSEPAPVAAKPEPPAPAPQPAAPLVDEGKVQIGADRGQAVSFDFDATLAEFQKGVESQLSGDAQGHYDLAMAYREMGLTQQAIESFRFAANDPTFKSRAAEMIGHCLLEEGRVEDASRELTEALADPELDAIASVGIRFQLGLALEAAGQLQDALHQFEQVFAVQASHRDVAQKIRVLRKDLDEAA